jgi:UDP-glucuronate 4-epimerase
MRVLVTGGAGFIGSALSRQLAEQGDDVVVVDCLRPNYDPVHKRANLDWVRSASPGSVRIEEIDLVEADLDRVFEGVDLVCHLAGQPGVRPSWGDGLRAYVADNILATERVLAAASRAGVQRVLYASSSSVYGEAARYPCHEDDLPRPSSPYGVTKLAGEHLVVAHAEVHGLPTVALRYFSVYGPRQRPDMGVRRLVDAAVSGSPFPLYGDGRQIRDMTYIDDVVAATTLAARADLQPGTVLNVAGGAPVRLVDLIDLVAEAVGRPVLLDHQPAQAGDVARTGGDTTRILQLLGWAPRTSLADGVRESVRWASQQPE